MSTKTGAGLVVALVLAAAVSARPAGAADESSWPRFPGSAYASQSDPADRAFIKEWEATPPKGYPTLSPANIAATKAAVRRYTEIVASGGWRPLPDVQLQQGMSHPAVPLLRERLLMSGDLREQGGGSNFDFYVDKAVKRYQASNGLAPTGIVDKRTVAALNIPAESRLKQLKANLVRLTEHSKAAAKRYVVVNIPAAQIEAVESDRIVSRHAGVVGKPDRATPILNSAIHELNFNAVWHLPPTVIEKDLIPKGQEMGRRNQSVLEKFNIEAFGADGKKLDPNKINWSAPATKSLTYQAAAGPRKSPWLRQDQLSQFALRLHARHALAIAVRAQFPRGELGLRARAGHREPGCMGPGRPGLEAGARAADEDERRTPRRHLEEAGAALFRLHHRLGDGRRHRPVPPRPLSKRRHRRDRRRLLKARRSRTFRLRRTRPHSATAAAR